MDDVTVWRGANSDNNHYCNHFSDNNRIPNHYCRLNRQFIRATNSKHGGYTIGERVWFYEVKQHEVCFHSCTNIDYSNIDYFNIHYCPKRSTR
jgi:hypothetical protein